MDDNALTRNDQDNTNANNAPEKMFDDTEHATQEDRSSEGSPVHTNDPTSAGAATVPPGAHTPSYSTLFLYALIALGVALFVRFFVAAPYIVSGASMEPTFDSYNYLIIDRLSYYLDDPVRGDVVVFHFPQDPSRSFIKRVIGLPHETVIIQGEQVRIENEERPEGFPLDEPYILSENMRNASITLELEEGEYFVMGDNRRASADSRVWGPVPRENIVGRALLRLFPFQQIEFLPGKARYLEE